MPYFDVSHAAKALAISLPSKRLRWSCITSVPDAVIEERFAWLLTTAAVVDQRMSVPLRSPQRLVMTSCKHTKQSTSELATDQGQSELGR